jgi:hypothetical protein
MKTKHKLVEKKYDTVNFFREIKENISKELFDKSSEQILEYLKINSLKFQNIK